MAVKLGGTGSEKRPRFDLDASAKTTSDYLKVTV